MLNPKLLVKTLAGLAVIASSFLVHSEQFSREKMLVIGVIGTNPTKSIKHTTPLAKYLAKQLKDYGIKDGKVIVAKDLRRLSKLLNSGRIDLVAETTFVTNELLARGDLELIARRWKNGVGEYNSVFFTRKQSNVENFDDLLGKVIAFEDRESTSAFYVPAYTMLSAGYELYELSHPRELPPSDSIGYFFVSEVSKTDGESNMMTWVHRNIVAASAFSNLDWKKEIPAPIRQQLKIFHTSEPIPRSLVMVRADMEPRKKSALQQALFNADKTEEGKAVLKRYKKTAKFDPITPELKTLLGTMEDKKKLVDEALL